MKILLIAPAAGKWQRIAEKKLFNGRVFRFSMLSLLTVAKLSPQDAEITIIDEQVSKIPFDENFDLVGITAMTAVSLRAYEIAASFRKKGIPVIMGGYHATLNPDEALEHVDAVVIGCAFGAWEALIKDISKNKLQRIYYGNPTGKIPTHLPRKKLIKSNYITTNATYATLGCKNTCHFCSISAFYEGKHHTRPINEILTEIQSFKEDFFIFVDDNLPQNREFAYDLLTKLVPLNKEWVTQASIDIVDDQKLLKLLQKSGCIGLFIGLESFNEQALNAQGKSINAPHYYKEAVKKIHDHGIFVESGLIFGFDNDHKDLFQNTLKMLKHIQIDAIQVSILTPQPGTALFTEMQGRLFDRNWAHYDYRHVVFKPKHMTPEELQAGADWTIKQFYSPKNIFMRSFRWLSMKQGWKHFLYPFILNLAYLGRTKRFNIRGYNPNVIKHKTWNPLKVEQLIPPEWIF